MLLLCIDDDPDDVDLFLDAVRIIDPAHTCVPAFNGREGVALLESMQPDRIFLDINMPEMNGTETLREIRRNPRVQHVPVFMLSTTTNPSEMSLCKKLGATACLSKPATFQELCMVLREALEVR